MTEYDVNSVSRANSDGLGCGKNGKSLENRRKKQKERKLLDIGEKKDDREMLIAGGKGGG